MDDKVQIKRCPFCGNEATLLEVEAHTHVFATFMPDHEGSAFIECNGCATAMAGDNAQDVIAAWNNRTEMDEVEKRARYYELTIRRLVEAWNSFNGAIMAIEEAEDDHG